MERDGSDNGSSGEKVPAKVEETVEEDDDSVFQDQAAEPMDVESGRNDERPAPAMDIESATPSQPERKRSVTDAALEEPMPSTSKQPTELAPVKRSKTTAADAPVQRPVRPTLGEAIASTSTHRPRPEHEGSAPAVGAGNVENLPDVIQEGVEAAFSFSEPDILKFKDRVEKFDQKVVTPTTPEVLGIVKSLKEMAADARAAANKDTTPADQIPGLSEWATSMETAANEYDAIIQSLIEATSRIKIATQDALRTSRLISDFTNQAIARVEALSGNVFIANGEEGDEGDEAETEAMASSDPDSNGNDDGVDGNDISKLA